MRLRIAAGRASTRRSQRAETGHSTQLATRFSVLDARLALRAATTPSAVVGPASSTPAWETVTR